MKDTFCTVAWHEINFYLNERAIKYCCRINSKDSLQLSDGQKLTVDLINNNQSLNQRREALLNGIQHHHCEKCWIKENNGELSYRQINSRQQLESSIKQNSSKNHIRNIEMVFDNVCNQSCLYCSPELSSIIAKELGIEQRLLSHTKEDLDTVIEWLTELCSTTTNKKHIRFTGGEPTASQNWAYFMERIQSIPAIREHDINFYIVTNGNINDKVRNTLDQYIKDFDITLNFSNEATGIVSENVRFGSNWELWCKNFEHYIQSKDVKRIMISPTPNIFTIKELPKFLEYVVTTVGTSKEFGINPNLITHPKEYATKQLPASFKKYVQQARTILDNSNMNWQNERNRNNAYRWLQSIEESLGTTELNHTALEQALEKQWIQKSKKLNKDVLLSQIS